MKKTCLNLAILYCSTVTVFAQTNITTEMDWFTGVLQISASRSLDPEMAPSDHPNTLEIMERELPALVLNELGEVAWNRRGTLADLMQTTPQLTLAMDALLETMKKEWSRLSLNKKSVEAKFILTLKSNLPEIFPTEYSSSRAAIPIGWHPTPEDPWSGIVIYAPMDLPIRGTKLRGKPVPALRARILSDDLQVLLDPNMPEFKSLAYLHLSEYEKSESLVGRRPYRAVARALYGEFPCDIILSKEDTQRIMASESSRQALINGNIVIIFNP